MKQNFIPEDLLPHSSQSWLPETPLDLGQTTSSLDMGSVNLFSLHYCVCVCESRFSLNTDFRCVHIWRKVQTWERSHKRYTYFRKHFDIVLRYEDEILEHTLCETFQRRGLPSDLFMDVLSR
ncbi:hypothetical protein TNCV_586751 [Trichonephila clavipes]|nr:hypothetical protein TNCV_586751 [Trichonephila clavipes]